MDIELFLKQKLASSKEEERVQTVRELTGFISETTMALLYQAMGDVSWRVRKQAVESFLSLPRAEELAADIIELLHDQDNVGLRNTAVEILIRLGEQAVPLLLTELATPDSDVRKFVLDVLGEIRPCNDVTAILPLLLDADRNVCAAAAETLGKIGAAAAVPALLEAMDRADLLLKHSILDALGNIGGSLPTAKLFRYQGDPLLRGALFNCIGRARLTEGIPLLVAGLNDAMGMVRESALLALAALSESAPRAVATELAGADAAAPVLAAFLLAERENLARAALRLVPQVRDARCAEALLSCLEREELCAPALEVLVAWGRPAVLPLLEQWPQAADPVRCHLAYLAGVTGCEEAEGLLLSGLEAADVGLRLASARALGALGKLAALPVLVELLQQGKVEHFPMIQDTLLALVPRFPEQIFAELAPLVENSRPEIRIVAISVLARSGCKKIEHSLTLAFKDEAAAVRCAAVRAFADCPVEGRYDALPLALTDEDAEVRRVAAEGLGLLQDDRAVNALTSALYDEDLWVRAAVIQSLERIGTPRCVALIKEALGDPVGLVCMTGLRALSTLDPATAFPLLVAALYHADEEVVNTALELLAATERRDWLEATADALLDHAHWEVRANTARAIATLGVVALAPALEERLLAEGEDLVRRQLEAALRILRGQGS